MSVKSVILKKVIPKIGYFFRAPKVMPVIYYHDIVEKGKEFSLMYTEESVFESHMRWLHEMGYRTYLFSEIPDMLRRKKNEKAVLITFDDGFRSNYKKVLPIMKKYGHKFNIFLATDYIGQDNYLTENMIREMQECGLVEFGCHTKTHCDCNNDFSEENYKKEFIESKQIIEDIVERKVTDFCFPYGYYNKNIIARLCKDGLYKNIYTSNYTKPTKIDNSVVTGRIGIDTAWSKDVFGKYVEGKYRILHYYSKIRVGIPKVK